MAGGFAIGITGAGANFETTGSETEGTGDNEKTATSVDTDVFYGAIFAEYAFGEMYGMTLGVSYLPGETVLGSKSRVDVNTATKPDSLDDDGTYTAKANVSNHTTIYVEPTFMPTENFGVYLKGGLARVTVNSLENIALGPDSSAYGDETVDGLMYGLGMKGIYDSGLMLKLEYIQVDYGTVTMTSTSGNQNTISADPKQAAVRFAIGWQF